MTESNREKSMQDILTKLRDPSNNDPAALYAQINQLRALLADALTKIGKTPDEPGCCCPDVDDLRPDCPIHGTEALATSRGFTYWPGGDAEPDDFDPDQAVLLRYGREFTPCGNGEGFNWSHDRCGKGEGPSDIIGYHRKVESDPEFAEVCTCPEGGWSEDCLEHPLPPKMPDNAFQPAIPYVDENRAKKRDSFAMAAAPFILGKFFGAVDYGDLVVHLFDFADSCLAESEKRAKGDAA